MLIWRKLQITLNMIKFEHTLFALPFAFIGALLARQGLPTLWQTFWILAAMVGARSAAMTFNRMADLQFDKLNPRTRDRALPRGTLSLQFAILFTIAMSLLFVVAAWQLNPLCFYLSLPTLAILFLYSYTKRFTSLSHLVLGFSIGCAPLAAWLAEWPATGGSSFERLQQVLGRVPAMIRQLEDRVTAKAAAWNRTTPAPKPIEQPTA